MKSSLLIIIPVLSITLPGPWIALVTGNDTEVQHVQFGSTATLCCDISYLYETTWLKHNPEDKPTVVLCTSLRDGNIDQGFQLSSRFWGEIKNRSLALSISGVEERDLGLYYCVAKVNKLTKVGRGTKLQASSGMSLGSGRVWYCVVVGLSTLSMVLAVIITHWKTS